MEPLQYDFADNWVRQTTYKGMLEQALSSICATGIPWARLFRVRRSVSSIHLRGVAEIGSQTIADREERSAFLREFKGEEFLIDGENATSLSKYLESIFGQPYPVLVQSTQVGTPEITPASYDLQRGLQLASTSNDEWPNYMRHFSSNSWVEVPINAPIGSVGLLSFAAPPEDHSTTQLRFLIELFRVFAAPILSTIETDELSRIFTSIVQHESNIANADHLLVDLTDALEEDDVIKAKEILAALNKEFGSIRTRSDDIANVLARFNRGDLFEVVSISELLSRCMEDHEKEYDVQMGISSDPSLEIVANGDVVSFVVANLIRNSKAHGADTINLHGARAGKKALISYYDNGSGIPSALKSSLFKGQVPSGTGGMGMGLFSCRLLLQTFGARIFVSPDQRDRGASFTMEFECKGHSR